MGKAQEDDEHIVDLLAGLQCDFPLLLVIIVREILMTWQCLLAYPPFSSCACRRGPEWLKVSD